MRYSIVPGYELIGEVQRYCEHLRRLGHSSLAVVNAGCCADYAKACDRLVYCDDMFSADALTAALSPMREQLDGFVTAHDRVWPAVFATSERLGRPFPGLGGQINARIKPRMRRLLRTVCPTKFTLLRRTDLTPAHVREVVRVIGVPFVIKPIWGCGSSYVEIVEQSDTAFERIAAGFAALARDSTLGVYDDGERLWNPHDELLLEAFVPGTEYSLEALVIDGVLQPLMIQQKYRSARLRGLDFETCNLSPTPLLDHEERAAIHEQAARVLAAIGLRSDFVHMEFKWNGRDFNVVEINPRMGGGSVPRTLGFWYGENVWDWPLRLMLGKPLPALPREWKGFLVGVFVNADRPGRVREVEGLDWVRERKGFVFETLYCRPGQIIPDPARSPGDRGSWMYAYDAFFWRDDLRDVDELHDEVRRRVRIVVDRNPEGEPVGVGSAGERQTK